MEGVIECVDFTAEKITNVEHSLESLEKSLAEATREIENNRIAVAKLKEMVSRQERHSRSFNIRVLGEREENIENCITILVRIITGSTIENAYCTGKSVPDRPSNIITICIVCLQGTRAQLFNGSKSQNKKLKACMTEMYSI